MDQQILKTATVPETAGAASDIDLSITTANIADNYLENQRLGLKQLADTITNGMGADLAFKSTSTRDDADELRDDLDTAFIYVLKGFMLWRRPEIQSAANRLMRIVDTHGGNLSKSSREIETGLYDALLVDLKKDEPMADLTTLNLLDLLTDMDAAETNYKALNQQIATEKTEKANYIAPTSIKRQVQGKIDSILGYLNTMSQVQPEIYGDLAMNIYNIIEVLNQKVRNKSNNDKPDGDNLSTNK
jgi:hypothetical protein